MKTPSARIAAKMVSLLLGLGLPGQADCAALLVGVGPAAAVGGCSYVEGELKVTENAALDRVWNAALAVMKDLHYPVTSQKKDSLTAELTARTAQDKKLHLKLKRITDDTTELRIRIGTFGDETLSLLIEDRIKKKL